MNKKLIAGLMISVLSAVLLLYVTRTRGEKPMTWKWMGVEVIGNHRVSSTDLLGQLPVHIGDIYREDLRTWMNCGDGLRARYGFIFARCLPVRYPDGTAYLVVDVVEPDQAYRNRFRNPPAKDVAWVTPEIKAVYDRLYTRFWALFNQGRSVQERADAGYLDYSDPRLHADVLKLIRSVPLYRDRLLDVLQNDRNSKKRADAANFLNWTVKDLEGTIRRANSLLDDPSSEVRNNISRFTLQFVARLQSDPVRRDVIRQCLLQLDRPSFGDRNKSLYNLLAIAQKFPEDRDFISEQGLALIQSIADASVLPNVGGTARDLLKVLKPESQ
jgi:hypothetical protein